MGAAVTAARPETTLRDERGATVLAYLTRGYYQTASGHHPNCAALRPTVELLQASALRLLDRMIEVNK